MTEAEELLKDILGVSNHITEKDYNYHVSVKDCLEAMQSYADLKIKEALEEVENIVKGDGSVSERMEDITEYINKSK